MHVDLDLPLTKQVERIMKDIEEIRSNGLKIRLAKWGQKMRESVAARF